MGPTVRSVSEGGAIIVVEQAFDGQVARRRDAGERRREVEVRHVSDQARKMQAPVPDTVADLLARSDAELVASGVAQDAGEAFVHAHLAALRAGAALVEARGRPGPRSRARTVWDMVTRVAPELADYAAFFAANAATRAAVEAGRTTVDRDRAERAGAVAGQFQEVVRTLVADGDVQGHLALRAS